MKKRVVIVGAGLCGSLLATLLRDQFDVTLVEQSETARPQFTDLDCDTGELNTSINRGVGLGGTTNYWHNALIELTANDLRKAGIASGSLEPYYSKAWRFFLSEDELRECNRIRDTNQEIEKGGCEIAHMVLPRSRANMWQLANQRYPGADIRIVYGTAEKLVSPSGNTPGYALVQTASGQTKIEADFLIASAGGLSTPALLARSLTSGQVFCDGYHDHPMAYVAKLRLRPGSRLKAVSCTTTESTEVRAGLVYEVDNTKAVVYIRPALNLGLKSLRGPARFILSDLRNNPFSPKKIFTLLTNIEAIREAVLFKTKFGFRGEYYSVLLLGEQNPMKTRGLDVAPGRKPRLNWHISEREHRAYEQSLKLFFEEFADDIVEHRQIPASEWEFRTAAHHSGAANAFLAEPGELNFDFYRVQGLTNAFACDASLLRAAGICNSGLTLVALCYRFAELMSTMR